MIALTFLKLCHRYTRDILIYNMEMSTLDFSPSNARGFYRPKWWLNEDILGWAYHICFLPVNFRMLIIILLVRAMIAKILLVCLVWCIWPLLIKKIVYFFKYSSCWCKPWSLIQISYDLKDDQLAIRTFKMEDQYR